MKQFTVKFTGRLKGAIGITFPIRMKVVVRQESEIRDKLYETYELISNLKVLKVEQLSEDGSRKARRWPTRLHMGRYFVPTARDVRGSDLFARGPHFEGKVEAQSHAAGIRQKGGRARVVPDAEGFTVWEAKGKTTPDISQGPGVAKAVSGYGGEIFALVKDGKIVGSSSFTGPRAEHEKMLRRNGYRIGKGTVSDAEYLGQTAKAKTVKRPRLTR